MAYVLPQPLIFQEFDLAIAANNRKMTALIAAPHAFLVRYDQADEQAQGSLGYYDPADNNDYAWPNFPTAATLDPDYVKVYVKNALLQYFTDSSAGGEDITVHPTYQNRIVADSFSFKTNGEDYPRDAAFLDRDVKVGDIVKVRGVVSATTYTLWSYVRGFDFEEVAAEIAAATDDDANETTQVASSSNSMTDGFANCVDVDSISHASYDGLRNGAITETYTVRVIEGSVDGDATTATLRVTSASGTDDVAELTPSAFGVATAIGENGFTATWDVLDGDPCSDDADTAGQPRNDFIEGQEWEFVVNQAFTAPVATSAGTYTGTRDTTYVIEVLEGGLFSETSYPKIKVSTTNGYDVSGPTVVTAASTAIAVGSHGVTISFSQTALCKGDKYYVVATASTLGACNTLILGHNLNSAITDAIQLELTLFIKKDMELPRKREGAPGIYNWEIQDDPEDGITINDAVTVYDSSWTDDGEQQPLSLVSEESKGYGEVFVEYRAWLSTLCGEITSVTLEDYDDVISGQTDPDNPLKYGVFKALSNSNGEPVKAIAVCDPDDVDSWASTLEVLDGAEVYGLVPCTHLREVKELFKAHALSQSDEEINSWRVAWFVLEAITEKAIVDADLADDAEEVLATITDDPDEDGSQYTKVTITSGNAGFVALDVEVGDIVRYAYTSDGYDDTTYSTGVVAEVLSEETLLITTGPDAAISVAGKIEVWRNLSATEQAIELAAVSGSYDCRRVMSVWPDQIETGGVLVDGYYLCCALAGLASGIVPHQGMTNLAVSGFDNANRTTKLFRRSQLNTMAEAGTWIVTQNTDGNIFNRHAVTTGEYADLNAREEMVTRNLDNISFYWLDRFSPYIGISNAVESMLDKLEAETLAGIQDLRSRNFVQRLGGQLVDAEISQLEISALFRDRIILGLDYILPYPLNNLEVRQRVVLALSADAPT